MRFRIAAVMALLAAAGLSGCGGGPKLVRISGTVLLNGKPLKDAEIVFIPADSNKDGLPGGDKSGPEGNYTAMSSGRIGLVPGKYRVMISKTPAAVSRAPKEHKDDPYMANIAVHGPEVTSEQARRPSTTRPAEIKGEFEREVPPEGGVLDFDVKAEAPKS